MDSLPAMTGHPGRVATTGRTNSPLSPECRRKSTPQKVEITSLIKIGNRRSIVVQRLTADQESTQCRLLYVPASEKRRQRDLPRKLECAPVPTLGQRHDFAGRKWAAQLLCNGGLVRHSVNLQATQPSRRLHE